MHNVEVFVNYDPPCNSVSTARRLNKRSSSRSSSSYKKYEWHLYQRNLPVGRGGRWVVGRGWGRRVKMECYLFSYKKYK